MIQFTHPEALILIPIWVAAAWRFPELGLLRPLRVGIGLLLMLLWLNPKLPLQEQGLDLWVLFDQSTSAEALLEPRQTEMESLLERSRGRHDRIFYIDYAEEVGPREPRQVILYPNKRNATRTGAALHYTLSRLHPNRSARLLLITDGYSTEPLHDAGLRLIDEDIPLDLRLLGGGGMDDYRVDDLRAPDHVLPGEPFMVEARIAGRPDATIPYTLYRDDTIIAHGDIAIRQGRAQVRWTDTLTGAGAANYLLRIDPENDTHPGNNAQELWVEARGGPRVLLVTGYDNDPLVPILQAQGLPVDVIQDPSSLQAGHLTGARAVILNNVPAYGMPAAFIEALPFFVREQGGGLLITGGRHSYAAGGYFETPVDPLLPVSMELKQEHRRLSVAMAIVMDRSGSMMAGVPGGGGMTKMDLANVGAARAIELLGDQDAVTVFAVDTSPHQILPLTRLGANRDRLIQVVRSIRSAGGGIYVYIGLEAAWAELQKAEQGQCHIILFSDASDTERPDAYQALLAEMLEAGVTLSVIALGTEQDRHAQLLIDIAARGHGRIIFNDDAATLPSIFAQETVALSRSAFVDEATALVPAAGWTELAARRLDWLPAVDGYNLNYLRDEAAVSALTRDEYEAPLIAHWTRGVGRVAAVTFPLGGPYSDAVRAWTGYGDLVQTVTRWLIGHELPPGIGLRTRRHGEWLELDLLYDDDWMERLAVNPPRLVTDTGSGGGAVRTVWRRVEPGRFSATLPLSPGKWIRGAVQLGDQAYAFGPIAAATHPEWQFNPARLPKLRQLVEASGGQELLDLATVWDAPVQRTFRDIRNLLLILLTVAFLIDALLFRLGGRMPSIHLHRIAKKPLRRTYRPTTSSETDHTKTPPREPPVTPKGPSERKQLFEAARIRNRDA